MQAKSYRRGRAVGVVWNCADLTNRKHAVCQVLTLEKHRLTDKVRVTVLFSF